MNHQQSMSTLAAEELEAKLSSLKNEFTALGDISSTTDEESVDKYQAKVAELVATQKAKILLEKKEADSREALRRELERAPGKMREAYRQSASSKRALLDLGTVDRYIEKDGQTREEWETKHKKLTTEIEGWTQHLQYWSGLIRDAAETEAVVQTASALASTRASGSSTPFQTAGSWTPPGLDLPAAIAASISVALNHHKAAPAKTTELKIPKEMERFEHGVTNTTFMNLCRWLAKAKNYYSKANGNDLSKSRRQELYQHMLDEGTAKRVIERMDADDYKDLCRKILSVHFNCSLAAVDERVFSAASNYAAPTGKDIVTFNNELTSMLEWTATVLSRERYVELLPTELQNFVDAESKPDLPSLMEYAKRRGHGRTFNSAPESKRQRTSAPVTATVSPIPANTGITANPNLNTAATPQTAPVSVLDQPCMSHPIGASGRSHTNRQCRFPSEGHKEVLRKNGVAEICLACKEYNKLDQRVTFKHFQQTCKHGNGKGDGKPISLKVMGASITYYTTEDTTEPPEITGEEHIAANPFPFFSTGRFNL
ncbi:hypothetical protein BDR26DRAFT_902869 [Obelidium mucronatum]|nr:hypothetical protein BDR26DRAFT_902869 [Obelidium mucronatum]